jgi:hypothetical protein
MRGKIIFVVGLGTGYVLGTKAGRERYEQIKAGADKVWSTPAVQSGVNKVQEFAGARVDTVKVELSKKARKALAAFIGREPLDGPQQSPAAAKAGSTAPRTPAPKKPVATKPAPAKPATKPSTSTTQPSTSTTQPSDD